MIARAALIDQLNSVAAVISRVAVRLVKYPQSGELIDALDLLNVVISALEGERAEYKTKSDPRD